MKHPPPLPAERRQIIAAHIAALDPKVAQLTTWLGMKEMKSGSLMISGIDSRGRDLHQLFAWNSQFQIPAEMIRNFLEGYLQALVDRRLDLVMELEGMSHRDQHCHNCQRITSQHSQPAIPDIPSGQQAWYCDSCHVLIEVL